MAGRPYGVRLTFGPRHRKGPGSAWWREEDGSPRRMPKGRAELQAERWNRELGTKNLSFAPAPVPRE